MSILKLCNIIVNVTISKQRTMFTVSEWYYLLRIFTFTFWTICVYSFLPVHWAVDKQTHEVDNNTCGGKNMDHKLCQNYEIYNYLDFLLFACVLKSTSVSILDSKRVFDLNKNGANWITRTLEHQVLWEKLMWSLIVSVTRYDISTYFDAWFCLRWQGLLSSGSLLAEDLNKWHFSSTMSTKENIIFTVLNCPWNYPFWNIPTSNFFWAVPVHQNSDWNYGFWKSGCCSCSCSYWRSPHSYFNFFHYSYFDFSCHIPTGSSSMDSHCLKYQV